FTKQLFSSGLSYLGCLIYIVIRAEVTVLSFFLNTNLPLAPNPMHVPDTGLAAFSRTVSVRSVLRSSNAPQVINVDACFIAMVFADNEHTVRDGSINPLPRVTVCHLLLPVDPKSAIPFGIFGTGPDQTVALPLSPECKRFFQCLSYHIGDVFRVTIFAPPFVMLITPATGHNNASTSGHLTKSFVMFGHPVSPHIILAKSRADIRRNCSSVFCSKSARLRSSTVPGVMYSLIVTGRV